MKTIRWPNIWNWIHKEMIGRKSEKYLIIQLIMNCLLMFNFWTVTFFTVIEMFQNQSINRELKLIEFHNLISVSLMVWLNSFLFDYIAFSKGWNHWRMYTHTLFSIQIKFNMVLSLNMNIHQMGNIARLLLVTGVKVRMKSWSSM